MVPEMSTATDRFSLSSWAIFCPFTPLTAQKMKISQKMKAPGDINILHKCTKTHDHRLYCSWDMVLMVENYDYMFLQQFLFKSRWWSWWNISLEKGKSHLKSQLLPGMALLKSQQSFQSQLKSSFLFALISNICFFYDQKYHSTSSQTTLKRI